MSSPYASSLTRTTPGGRSFLTQHARSVTLANAQDPPSMTTETDDVWWFNGDASNKFHTVWNAPSSTLTSTSPLGRTTTQTLDAKGRVTTAAIFQTRFP